MIRSLSLRLRVLLNVSTMNDLKIYSINRDFNRFDLLEKLFLQFYRGMEEQGILIKMIDEGEKIWMKALKQRIGGVSVMFVAEINEEIIGFSTGLIKILPLFLGACKVGYVDAIFVIPQYRKTGVSVDLYNQLEDWFISKKVESIELQVLPDNLSGCKFWNKMGYHNELIQMRKKIIYQQIISGPI
jgi:GNAT superfamily N-acetyltransferase